MASNKLFKLQKDDHFSYLCRPRFLDQNPIQLIMQSNEVPWFTV